MADFLRTTNNDWDLEAIIRGWGGGGSSGCAVVQLPPPPVPPVLGFDGFGFEFDELEVTRGVVNELEEMYKPFVVQVEQIENESPRSSQIETTTSPCSSSFALFDHDDDVEKSKEMETAEMKEPVDLDGEDHAQARSSKRRKSKHNIVRVVHRGVGEDEVLMDKWNWRKYGQKVIKGSPYPRSYYRCSSSSGCHARKHVEKSKDDCHTFIVTYIADHSHSPPTRRHAQAGRKITKFSSSSSTASTTNVVVDTNNKSTPPESMTWTISDPSINEVDGDQGVVGGGSTSVGFVESTGLEVMKELFSTSDSFDHDLNNWEFDPFFSTFIY